MYSRNRRIVCSNSFQGSNCSYDLLPRIMASICSLGLEKTEDGSPVYESFSGNSIMRTVTGRRLPKVEELVEYDNPGSISSGCGADYSIEKCSCVGSLTPQTPHMNPAVPRHWA